MKNLLLSQYSIVLVISLQKYLQFSSSFEGFKQSDVTAGIVHVYWRLRVLEIEFAHSGLSLTNIKTEITFNSIFWRIFRLVL